VSKPPCRESPGIDRRTHHPCGGDARSVRTRSKHNRPGLLCSARRWPGPATEKIQAEMSRPDLPIAGQPSPFPGLEALSTFPSLLLLQRRCRPQNGVEEKMERNRQRIPCGT